MPTPDSRPELARSQTASSGDTDRLTAYLRGAATCLRLTVILILICYLPGDLFAQSAAIDALHPEHSGPALVRPPLGSLSSRMAAALGDSAHTRLFAAPARALPGDEHWSTEFGRGGIYGTVFTACEHDGDLYVGGSFPYAGPTRCNNVARWDGAAWQPLATGVWRDSGGTKVTRLMEFGGDLLVAGGFNYAGGVPLAGVRVARWDGAAWQAMTESAWRDSPEDLIEYDTHLIAVGGFWSPTLSGHAGILEWTGTEWVNASTLTAAGRACVHDGRLIVSVASTLESWDGVSSQLEPAGVGCPYPVGLSGYVMPVLSTETALVVGGSFQCAVIGDTTSVPASNVAAWDGTVFDGLDGGVDDADFEYYDEAPMVWSLGLWNGDLIAGGDFLSSRNRPNGLRHIGRWDGSAWNPLGGGCSENVYTLLTYDNKLVAGGWMGYAGNQDVWGIASWDGTNWSGFGSMGHGVNNPVYALTVWEDKLIAAGLFDRAGSVWAHGIAAFDGVSWQPLGSGLDGFPPYLGVLGLGACDGSLIVAGDIGGAGGVVSPHVARWDGSQWWPMGAGLPEAERAICEFEGQLYVGKYRWTGATWEQWLLANGPVACLINWNGELLAGGDFSMIGSEPFEKIVRYDGAGFLPVGIGLPGAFDGPMCFTTFQDDLIVGGALGGQAGGFVSRWDGTQWNGYGTGPSTWVTSLVSHNDILFTGGLFEAVNSGTTIANRIAYWDGQSWRAMGNGCTGANYYRPEAKALALYHGSLYVGGDFTIAGDAPSMFLAKWRDPAVPVYLRRFSAERSGATAVVRCELGDPLLGARLEIWRELPGRERSRVGELADPGSTSLMYTDLAPSAGEADYWLREVSASGVESWHGPAHLAAAPVPERLALTSVAPNPFNPRTTIRFDLPGTGPVRLAVYDQFGRLVRTLTTAAMAAGSHALDWDGRDDGGRNMASGAYFVRLTTEQGRRVHKVTLVR